MAKYDEVMIGLKQGKYAPAYMLCGKEPYYIDLVANYIENNVLDEMAREFDQTIIYGKDLSGGDVSPVIGAARGFAMMGGYKVIIVKEAQNIKKWEALAMYMDNPQPSTILVFCYKYGSPDKRLNLFKTVGVPGYGKCTCSALIDGVKQFPPTMVVPTPTPTAPPPPP